MRPVALGLFALMAAAAGAQSWMPLSSEVERPYLDALYRVGSPMHTSIHPYRWSEVRALDPKDSLRPAAALPALDRWAGARNGRRLRWGPLLDLSGGLSADTAQSAFHRAGAGAWLEQDLGRSLCVHLDGRYWHESFPGYLDTLARATTVTPGEGFAQREPNGFTHFDANGYLSWDASRHFNFTAGRGRNFFGEGYRSLLLSDEAYAYPYLRVTTTVWKVKYVNLFCAMNDVRGANGDPAAFQRKWSSMHYLSWQAHKHVNVALFESVMWSQGDPGYPRGFDLNYLNPIIFYRPVEYSVGSPDNALLGGAVHAKVSKATMLYAQVMLDEFLLREVRAGMSWFGNKQGVQFGVFARNAFRVPGLVVRGEWNLVRPFMYTHSDTRQNYSHMGQPLAHPYGSGFQEVLLRVDRSKDRWRYGLHASVAWLGMDSTASFGNNIFRPESDRPVKPNGLMQNYGYDIGLAMPYTLTNLEAVAGWLVDPASGTRLEASYLYRLRATSWAGDQSAHVLRLGVVCYWNNRHTEQDARYVLR